MFDNLNPPCFPRQDAPATLLLVAVLCLTATPAVAQPQLEDIVVTANRRASQLMDTPLAITALDASALETLAIDNGQDLSLHSPSLNIAGTPGQLSIRGVGQANSTLGSDPGVAVYADGVYTPGGAMFEANQLFDVQRVEVLRGPQGTLYGRNAMGGAINITSLPPTITWETRVVAEIGNYDHQALQGLMSGPITDQLSMVVSGSTIKRDAFQDASASGEGFNNRDAQTLRASFKYHWNNVWYSRIQVSWADSEQAPSSSTAESTSAYLLNEFALGDYRLKYLASYSEYELEQAAPRLGDTSSQKSDITSHDLQLYSALQGPLNFVSGLYYYHGEENWLYREESKLETTAMAVYGQATWDWNQALRLTAGLRYSLDEKDGEDIYRHARDDWDSVDWRLGLDYRMGSDHLLYGALSTGYRSGGFIDTKPTESTGVDQVDPEDLLSFELGYKGSLLDGRLHLASAAYYYDYRDLQLVTQDIPGGGLHSSGNADDATAWGVELEAVGLVGKHLTLGGSWSYNRTRYGECASSAANCVAGQDLESNDFPLTPDHMLDIYSILHWPVGNIAMSWTVNYMYVGEQYMSPFKLDELDRVDAWDRWDSQLSATWDVWSLAAFVKNIGDERNWVFGERPGTISHDYGAWSQLTDPRTYGLRLVYQL